ncbi:MAG: NAD(P)-dependent oxidoreductase [Acidocella sp.]|nr:NAD(P)-dependent oxidoreductase [Acidocella sp.]
MSHRILITGSSGLVGTALISELASRNVRIQQFDIRGGADAFGDVRDSQSVQKALQNCDGVIHLAAISRVVWGERDPDLCWSTNVDGLRNVLDAAASSPCFPWVIFASSREVYGQPLILPASEETPLQPVNIYGRSKVEGEKLVDEARQNGLRACTIRLSNVFGTTFDHADRVVPAFARGAVKGDALRVDGANHTFDFTHVDDVARGIALLVEHLLAGKSLPPPIHFVSGLPTTLGELASLAIRIARSNSNTLIAPPRDFDVARFYGSPTRAHDLLGWTPFVGLKEGLTRLIQAFSEEKEVCSEEAVLP